MPVFAPLEALATSSGAERVRFTETAAGIALMIVAIWGLIICGAGWALFKSREAALQVARITTGNLAASLAQDMAGRLDLADSLVVGLVEQLETSPTDPAAIERLDRYIAGRVQASDILGILIVTDRDGRVIASSAPALTARISARGQTAFTYFSSHDSRAHFLTSPHRSWIDNSWIIGLSHRWNRPDGSFGGTVSSAIDLGRIEASFRTMDVGPAGVVSLFTLDGTLLARLPPTPELVGQRFPLPAANAARALSPEHGLFVSTSPLDDVTRLYAYRRVRGYDLLQNVGLPLSAVLAGWRLEMAKVTVLASALIVGSGLFGLKLIRDSRRRTIEKASFRLLADNASDMISCFDRNGVRRYVSPAAKDILGYRPDELIGGPPVGLAHPDDQEIVQSAQQALLSNVDQCSVTYRIRHRDGHYIWADVRLRQIVEQASGQMIGFIGALRDISALKAAESALADANERLQRLANSDSLTGLANRRHFTDILPQEVERHRREQAPLSVLLIDVDHFKAFNDSYGHPAGDACLQAVAQAVAETLQRPADLAARYGGEEFVVLLPMTDAQGARHVAERIARVVRLRAIPHAHGVDGIVTVSIGVAGRVPEDSAAGERLVKQADDALYVAKAAGRGRVHLADTHPAAA